MPDSDTIRCAALAEWMGRLVFTATSPEWRTQLVSTGLQYVLFGERPAELRLYDGMRFVKNWHPHTDPVAALELLDWLASKGWDSSHDAIGNGIERYCQVKLFNESQTVSALSYGLPSVALPRAIFEAACRVMDAEKESEAGDGNKT